MEHAADAATGGTHRKLPEARSLKPDTILAHAGRRPSEFGGAVNTPVVRASTILYPDVQSYRASRSTKFGTVRYGRYGTQTAIALMEALSELEGGEGAVLCPSGLAAITMVLNALLKPGDHLLVVDSVYAPTRAFCDNHLAAQGITVTYYDPCADATIEDKLTDRTKVVFAESPGSLTFEVQDLPALANVCRQTGIALVVDGTWATPVFCKPLALGADIVIHSATKYIVGHSDAMLGVAVTKEPWLKLLQSHAAMSGVIAGPDECWLALRGLRTMGVRMRQHQDNAMLLTDWLHRHPAVRRVLYPGHASHPHHELWKRDFHGASGLFGVELQPAPSADIDAFINALSLFGIGSSWGGYESLILPSKPERSATRLGLDGQLLRIHAGLEDFEDLIADLQQGLTHLVPDHGKQKEKDNVR